MKETTKTDRNQLKALLAFFLMCVFIVAIVVVGLFFLIDQQLAKDFAVVLVPFSFQTSLLFSENYKTPWKEMDCIRRLHAISHIFSMFAVAYVIFDF